MKDTEFFELLNLYLDHEISAADAARLEAEVQANPDRRRVYQEYCRMQKACTVLAKDFAEQPAERKVIAFEPRRSAWAPGAFAFGGLGVAAACVALVLVNREPTASGDATSERVVSAPVAPTKDIPVTVARPVEAAPVARMVTTVPVRRSEMRPMLASMPLTLTNAQADNAEALMVASQQNARALEWMRNLQLAPIQQMPMEELRLDARSPLQPASRTYSSGRPIEGAVEMTAFKFNR